MAKSILQDTKECFVCRTTQDLQLDKGLDLKLKEMAQAKFEETHTREEFIRIFGRNYL